MQTRSIDGLIKEVYVLYNQDKLPAQQKTEEEIETMIKDHFLYLKKFFQKPYNVEFHMEKVARFKIRYRHVRKEINDLIRDLKAIRDNKLESIEFILTSYNKWLPDNEKKDISQIQKEMKEEVRYWWILKQKYMSTYTKTGKYKRLQALRKMWQQRNEEGGKVDIRMKEDYRPYIKTQMPTDMATWDIDTE